MKIRQKISRLSGRRDRVALYGLASLILVAGVSKFFRPGVWAAYEPVFVTKLSPVSATTHMYVAGFIESFAGILLFLRKRILAVSTFLTFWLLAITIGVLSLGFWSIALRDVAWVILAAFVALNAYESEEN